jgi:leucine-zipper of insertion element IS481
VSHRNAPLSPEGHRRLVQRCQHRAIAHVAAEMGISRSCAAKWVNRYREYGELDLHDRSSTPHRQPSATPAEIVAKIEHLRRSRKWSASRIAFELKRRRHSDQPTHRRRQSLLGLHCRRFIDPNGDSNREPRTIMTYADHFSNHPVNCDRPPPRVATPTSQIPSPPPRKDPRRDARPSR